MPVNPLLSFCSPIRKVLCRIVFLWIVNQKVCIKYSRIRKSMLCLYFCCYASVWRQNAELFIHPMNTTSFSQILTTHTSTKYQDMHNFKAVLQLKVTVNTYMHFIIWLQYWQQKIQNIWQPDTTIYVEPVCFSHHGFEAASL